MPVPTRNQSVLWPALPPGYECRRCGRVAVYGGDCCELCAWLDEDDEAEGSGPGFVDREDAEVCDA